MEAVASCLAREGGWRKVEEQGDKEKTGAVIPHGRRQPLTAGVESQGLMEVEPDKSLTDKIRFSTWFLQKETGRREEGVRR